MKKNTITLLAALLTFASLSQASEKRSLEQIMLEDARLSHTTCLRMISSMKCDGSGDEGSAYATCSLQMAYRLDSGEIAQFPIKSDYTKYNSTNTGLGWVTRASFAIVTLGGTESIVAASGARTAYSRAEHQLRTQLLQIAEQLQLKDIKKCQDFKDDSKTVHGNVSSHVAE